MLRPPRIQGDLPTITAPGAYGPFTVPSVQGSAWRAPDGSVGIFILNYDRENAHDITWTQDLNEIAGISANDKLTVTRWTPHGEEAVGERSGGVLTQTVHMDPLDVIALRLEKAQ